MNQADMNQDVRENLSAGIDGELSKQELRFLLRRLDHDISLQQAWGDYHLARDGLRRQLSPMASTGFSARVMLAIEKESVPVAASRRSHWLRWSAGGAIAASVAAAALMIGQPAGDSEHGVALTAHRSNAVASNVVPAAQPAAVSPAAVPPWLSGNSAGLLSQQASATLGAPLGQNQPGYARGLSGFSPLHRYRTLNNNDGSYLLLLDPEQSTPDSLRQATTTAH